MSEEAPAKPCPLPKGFVGGMALGLMEIHLASDILKILEANKDKIFSADALARKLPKKYSLEQIQDAMWLLVKEGKVKLWVRFP